MSGQLITKPLGEIVEFQRGLTYSKRDEVESSSNIVLRANNIDLATNRLDLTELRHISNKIEVPPSKKLKRGSLLVCTASGSKSHLGKVALVDDDYDYAFGGFMGQLTAKPIANPKYLFYFMISDTYKEHIRALSDGVNINNLRFDDLKPLQVPLPPLPEQQRIVATIDEAFAGLATATANAEKNLENARELFEGYLNSILADDSFGSTKTLGEVCGISSRLVDPREPQFIDLPHLGAGNMASKTGELSEIKTAREEGLKSGKFLFDSTMVLYSKIRPYLMKACRPDFQGLCSADVYPLSPNVGQLDRNFLFHLLMSKDFTEFAISGSDRAGMPKVNRDHLFRYSFKAPSVEEQAQLANKLDEMSIDANRLVAFYERRLADLAALKQSILQGAFSGELTSPPSRAIEEAAE